MEDQRVKMVLDAYAVVLRGLNAEPVRDEHPERLIEVGSVSQKNHLLWMCEEAKKIVDEGRTEKAMRWLGFLQGALWALRVRTLEQMKHDNAPPGAVFDKSRV